MAGDGRRLTVLADNPRRGYDRDMAKTEKTPTEPDAEASDTTTDTEAAVVGPDDDQTPVAPIDAEPAGDPDAVFVAAVDDDELDGATEAYDFEGNDANVKAAAVQALAAETSDAFASEQHALTDAGYSGAMLDRNTGAITTNGGTPVPPVPGWGTDEKLESSTKQRGGTNTFPG